MAIKASGENKSRVAQNQSPTRTNSACSKIGHLCQTCDPASPASGVMMIPIPKAGILCEVQHVEQARQVTGINEIRLTIPVGQPVVPLPEGSQYLGFIFSPSRVSGGCRSRTA